METSTRALPQRLVASAPSAVARAAVATDGLRAKAVIEDLDFFYGKTRALKHNNVVIHDRRVTALIGPSGCGKSTLLRVLNRIYDLYPDQRATGRVLLDGTDILDRAVDVDQLRARVGMVF